MNLLSIFMTSIGLSMDAFAVALAKGMTLKKHIWKNALKISFLFGGFQALMPLIGWIAARKFRGYIESFDHWIAFILLGAIGGKMIYESINSKKECCVNNTKEMEEICMESLEDNEEFSIKNLTILAIATSIDALAVGVSFAFLNINIIPSIIMIGCVTFILCLIAVFVGKKLGCILQTYAEIVGGIILIIIGINILLEHIS
ncbi:putative Mn2+ efflux pump MntP [Clostridium moniliforme]|uniref:Putative manganese efflux pump MntP n=1 Tax=Clostridium moniliforme TaxID=39489 RepID=A0ABS4F028_9CLOT|nr:manganese efflux pump MntP family protein [Clostridium moniliforme]MBP1889604.1 putative Mn2+ efflux pump MntP [Clostridium moniliforme]